MRKKPAPPESSLVTSLARRDWKADGTFQSSLIPQATVVKEISVEKKIPLIDLHEKSIKLYKKLGVHGFDEYSALKKDGSIDTTHLNDKGSDLIGKIVADELKIAMPELAPNIN
jgi:lysophospholipase L1-like esterase